GACDLDASLASVPSAECRQGIECELAELRDLVSDGHTGCAERLFRDAYRFMARKAARIARGQRDRITDDLARMKAQASSHCPTPVQPPLGGSCSGKTTPEAAAECIGDAADSLADDMLPGTPVCALPAAPPPSSLLAPVPGAPNFVIILSDDQRWDMVDDTHQAPARPGPAMPFVTSELANHGVTFTNGQVTTALCAPSRASILRAQYGHRTGVLENRPPDGGAEVFDDTSTIATWLHDAHYRTGFVGKYLNGYSRLSPCIPPGWDDWHGQVQVKYYDYDLNDNGVVTHFGRRREDYSGDVMNQRALTFIHAFDGRPFFLYLNQKAPHAPAIPAQRHIGLFDGIAPFRPPNYAEADVSDKPAWVRALTWDSRGCDTCPPGHKCDACDTDKFFQLQLETLQAVDEGVRDIVSALAAIGQLDNTLIVYTSDNGYSLGSHRWKVKQCPYQECMRVPMIMRYDRLVAAPRTDDHVVTNVDLAPTLLELAGTVAPAGYVVNGHSVVPLLRGGAADWPLAMLNEHWNGKLPTNALVRQGRCSVTIDTPCKIDAHCPSGETCTIWKWVEYITTETELYNLNADPFELQNVASDPANAALESKLADTLHRLEFE
ncbi:MAG TPA: sulfatase, partial [Candidatus Binatia bacterium]|nr:sulfatase [Candidatus Binatia bacterium]